MSSEWIVGALLSALLAIEIQLSRIAEAMQSRARKQIEEEK